jgi:hypothetical protein
MELCEMNDRPIPPLPPDLVKFCEPFGGIGNMNAERWEQWEQQNKAWQREIQEREKRKREGR